MRTESFVDHVAFYVKDIVWHINFFEEVLGLTIREIEGQAENPKQVWFHGGIQLISAANFEGPEGRLAHIGFMVKDQNAVLDLAYAKGVTELPQGRNWIELPDGLSLEILQAKTGSVDEFYQIQVR